MIPKNSKYQPELDGIRALAIISVFIFHLNPSFLSGGFVGVDVFFVLSGFLITGIISRDFSNGHFSFINFYNRRIKRIMPPLVFMQTIAFLAFFITLQPKHLSKFLDSFFYSSLQISNFFFAKQLSYFDDSNSLQPLLHTWSLSVEEQFYLIWPLLIFLCLFIFKKSRLSAQISVLILSSASFLISLFLLKSNPNLSFYMFFSRGWEFGLGAFLSLHALKKPSRLFSDLISLVSMIALIVSFFIITNNASFLSGLVLLPTISTSLLIYSIARSFFAKKILSSSPLVFIGKTSYSLYLWHWPIIIFYQRFFKKYELSLKDIIIITLFTLLLSTFSYYFVENTFRYKRTKFVPTLLLTLSLMFGLSLLSVFSKQAAHSEWRAKQSLIYPKARQSMPAFNFPFNQNSLQKHKLLVQKKGYNPDILLYGNSHALAYSTAVNSLAQKNHLKAICYYSNGLVPFIHDTKFQLKSFQEFGSFLREQLSCGKFKYVFFAARTDHYMLGRRFEHKEDPALKIFMKNENHPNKSIETTKQVFFEEMSKTISWVQKRGMTFIILDQVPPLSINPQDYLYTTCIDRIPFIKKLRTPPTPYTNLFLLSLTEPATHIFKKLNTTYACPVFDPKPYLTSFVLEETLLYSDRHHMTHYASEILGMPLTTFFSKVLLHGSAP